MSIRPTSRGSSQGEDRPGGGQERASPTRRRSCAASCATSASAPTASCATIHGRSSASPPWWVWRSASWPRGARLTDTGRCDAGGGALRAPPLGLAAGLVFEQDTRGRASWSRIRSDSAKFFAARAARRAASSPSISASDSASCPRPRFKYASGSCCSTPSTAPMRAACAAGRAVVRRISGRFGLIELARHALHAPPAPPAY